MSSERVLSWTAKMNADTSVVHVEIQSADGEMTQKGISLEDFRSAINNAVENSQKVRIGRLPRGYYDGSIDAMDPHTFQCVVVVPAGTKAVSYYDTAYEVPYPPTVFLFNVEAGRLNGSRAFFVKSNTPDSDAVLYQYCFGNVNSDSGSVGNICWGGNILPDLSCMEDINQLVALFLEARVMMIITLMADLQRALRITVKHSERFTSI